MTDVVRAGTATRRVDARPQPTDHAAIERTVDDLPVRGALPAGLDGRFLLVARAARTGDDPAHPSVTAMVHEVRIAGGRAHLRSRRIPHDGPPAPADGLVEHAGRLLALGAHARPVLLDDSLVPTGDDAVGATGGSGAHAHVDPVWDELLLVAADPRGAGLNVTTLDVRGRVRRTVEVADAGLRFLHDFAVTDAHVVVIDSGAVEDASGIHWDPTVPARIGLLDRTGEASEPVWFTVAPRFVWHLVNAYECDGEVVVDHIAHRPPGAGVPGPAPVPSASVPALCRTVVDPRTGEVRDEVLDDRSVEHPVIDPTRTGLHHRVVYAALAGGPSVAHAGDFVGLVRYDLRDGSATEHRFADSGTVVAPAFARRAGSTGEDDGWVLALVTDHATGTTRLVVLDPRTFDRGPVAEVVLPAMVPGGEHSVWMAAEA